jgi:hypothetical protein
MFCRILAVEHKSYVFIFCCVPDVTPFQIQLLLKLASNSWHRTPRCMTRWRAAVRNRILSELGNQRWVTMYIRSARSTRSTWQHCLSIRHIRNVLTILLTKFYSSLQSSIPSLWTSVPENIICEKDVGLKVFFKKTKKQADPVCALL